MTIPKYMLIKLRGRLGLEPYNNLRDKEFYQMTPVQIVKECTAWEIGDADWATIIADFMVSMDVQPKDFFD